MKLKLKSINIGIDDLDTYIPRDPYHFGIWVDFEVESVESGGAHWFGVFICSPSWIFSRSNKKLEWGKDKIFLLEYDCDEVVEKIKSLIYEVATMDISIDQMYWVLSRYAKWEFENYGEKNIDSII